MVIRERIGLGPDVRAHESAAALSIAREQTPLPVQESVVVFSAEKARTVRKPSLVKRADRYFRREDTALARTIQRISPHTGESFVTSRTRRVFDLAVAVPMLPVSVPLSYTLAGVNKLLYPSEPAFFSQDRVGHNGEKIRIKKIRTMVSGADRKSAAIRQGVKADHDPDVTGFGRMLRKTKLDELPQVPLVVKGNLSVVGIRVLPQSVFDLQQQIWTEEEINQYRNIYNKTPLGLTGINQIIAGETTNDSERLVTDGLLNRKISLGNSLFMLWQTSMRAAKLL